MSAKISLKRVRELSNYSWILKTNDKSSILKSSTACILLNYLMLLELELVKTSRQLESSLWINVINLTSSLLQPGKYR